MRLLYLSIVGAFFYCQSAFALCDSIGVKKINNQVFVLHKVGKGEGLYSIARKYHTSATEINKANSASKKELQIGQVLMVPYIQAKKNASVKNNKTAVKTDKPKTVVSSNNNADNSKTPVYYTVIKGETMYSVAKKHGIQVADICKWNKIKGNALTVGQKIIVGYKTPEKKQEVKVLPDGTKPKWERPTIVLVSNDNQPEKTTYTPKETTVIKPKIEDKEPTPQFVKNETKSTASDDNVTMVWKEIRESGVASWIDDQSINTKTKFALHKTAPVGTVIKLINPMNGQETLVKVIGKLPDDETEQNVLMKITKSTAEKLGLRDKYFRLDMSYGMEVAKK